VTVLRTARLVTRPACPANTDAFLAVASDWEVVSRLASWPSPADRAFTGARLSATQPTEGMRAAILRDRVLIGTDGVEGLRDQLHAGPSCQGPRLRHRGMHGPRRLRLDPCPSLQAGAFKGNGASIRVLEKLGFARGGKRTHPCRVQGRDLPVLSLLHMRVVWNAALPTRGAGAP
jgi:RimJ/RimL family protein N-acetyltransferase